MLSGLSPDLLKEITSYASPQELLPLYRTSRLFNDLIANKFYKNHQHFPPLLLSSPTFQLKDQQKLMDGKQLEDGSWVALGYQADSVCTNSIHFTSYCLSPQSAITKDLEAYTRQISKIISWRDIHTLGYSQNLGLISSNGVQLLAEDKDRNLYLHKMTDPSNAYHSVYGHVKYDYHCFAIDETNRVFSTHNDGQIKRWEFQQNEEKSAAPVTTHRWLTQAAVHGPASFGPFLRHMVILPGHKLAVDNLNGLEIYNTNTGAFLKSIAIQRGYESYYPCAALSADRLLTLYKEVISTEPFKLRPQLRVYHLGTEVLEDVLSEEQAETLSHAVVLKNGFVALAFTNNSVEVYDKNLKLKLYTFKGENPTRQLQASGSDNSLMIFSENGGTRKIQFPQQRLGFFNPDNVATPSVSAMKLSSGDGHLWPEHSEEKSLGVRANSVYRP